MTRRSTASRRSSRRRSWVHLGDDDLLDVRMCDLGVEIAGSDLEARVERLHAELERRGLRFRPYVWLSTDWFTPDRSTGFAIPFFLAHPRLQRLEHKQMLEVEGGNHDWCMKLMRHEAAHAIDNAYRLHRKKRWREVFGRFSEPYRSSYVPDPASRDYVYNLPYWYSQSHPAEDWAETFAVWLRPGFPWRKRYADWPALRKLEFVDELMDEVGDRPAVVRSRVVDEPLHRVKMTLREYYDRKRGLYEDEASPVFDGQLLRLFQVRENGGTGPTAAAFLRRHRRRLVRHVAKTTGQNAYLVDHVVGDMTKSGKRLRLEVRGSESDALIETAVLLTTLTTQFLYGGHPRYQR